MIEFHADDYGLFCEQSQRIRGCIGGNRIVNGLSIMPNSKYLAQCMRELNSVDKKLNLTVHLNLVEGKCLSAETDVPDLVRNGVFNISFGKLLTVSFVPFLRGKYKKQIKAELWNQISNVLPYLDSDKIRLDSHCHYHVIPVVFDALIEIIRENSLHVSYIRQPREKLLLLLKHRASFEKFSFINVIKVLMLNSLYIRNRIFHSEIMKKTEQMTFLGGVLFSGCMGFQNAAALFSIAKGFDKAGKNVELLFHPGGVFEKDDLAQITSEDDRYFMSSDDRNMEWNAMSRLSDMCGEHKWRAETLQKEKLTALAQLEESHYGTDNDISHVEYLEHEYYRNPAGDVLMEIAWNDEKQEAGGLYAVIPIWLVINGKKRKCLMSVNTLTKEEYRGQGIFTQLASRCFDRAEREGYTLVYGMPNQNSYPGFLKYLHFSDLGAIPLYLKPLNVSNMVYSYLNSKFLAGLAKPFNCLFKLRERMPDQVRLVNLTKDNLDIADIFWEKIKTKYRVMIARDSSYITYRFLDIPRRKYICMYAFDREEVVAYAVGRVMDVAGIHCGMIADFLFLEGHEESAKYLLTDLIRKLKMNGADMAGCMLLPSSSEAALIRKCGFFKCPKFMEPQPFRFIYRSFDKTVDDQYNVNNLSNWFFTMGDYDVV